MKGVTGSGQSPFDCPVCKENIGPMQVPTCMVFRLIAEQEVTCRTCNKTVDYENSRKHICDETASPPAQQTPALVSVEPTQALQQILNDVQAGRFSPEVEKICTAYVRAKLQNSADVKTVLFKTGGKVCNFCMLYSLRLKVLPIQLLIITNRSHLP